MPASASTATASERDADGLRQPPAQDATSDPQTVEPGLFAPPETGSSMWAWASIASGALLLLGGAAAAAWLALQDAVMLPTASSLSGHAPSASGSTVPSLPAPNAAPARAAEREQEPEIPQARLSPPQGQRAHAGEASSLLPVHPQGLVWGVADAPATLALFGDLECPHTIEALRGVLRLQARLGDDLRVTFHHFLIHGHALAPTAAGLVARATLRRGPSAGWELLHSAARAGKAPDRKQLQAWFQASGDKGPLEQLTEDAEVRRLLTRDAELAAELNVRATPIAFVNGRRVEGWHSDQVFKEMIEQESRSVAWLRAEGVEPAVAYTRRLQENLLRQASGAPDRFCVPIAGAPSEGPRGAEVTLVEFSDFECGHCRELQPALRTVLQRHRGKIRRVWRSFALPQHQQARRLAAFSLAARGAGNDAAFWRLHELLFEAAELPDEGRLRELALRVGLDPDLVFHEADGLRVETALAADQALAAALGLGGTPTLFINGRALTGAAPVAVLEAIVQEELQSARRLKQNGTPPEHFEGLLCAEPSAP